MKVRISLGILLMVFLTACISSKQEISGEITEQLASNSSSFEFSLPDESGKSDYKINATVPTEIAPGWITLYFKSGYGIAGLYSTGYARVIWAGTKTELTGNLLLKYRDPVSNKIFAQTSTFIRSNRALINSQGFSGNIASAFAILKSAGRYCIDASYVLSNSAGYTITRSSSLPLTRCQNIREDKTDLRVLAINSVPAANDIVVKNGFITPISVHLIETGIPNAPNPVTRIVLPTGLSFVAVAPPVGTACTHSSGVINCIASAPFSSSNGIQKIVLQARPTLPQTSGTYFLTVYSDAQGNEINTDNNMFRAKVQVNPPPPPPPLNANGGTVQIKNWPNRTGVWSVTAGGPFTPSPGKAFSVTPVSVTGMTSFGLATPLASDLTTFFVNNIKVGISIPVRIPCFSYSQSLGLNYSPNPAHMVVGYTNTQFSSIEIATSYRAAVDFEHADGYEKRVDAWIYSPVSTQVQMNLACFNHGDQLSMNLDLVKGWNFIISTGGFSHTLTSSSTLPADMSFYYVGP
jgi:hypothetical protein